MQYAFVGNHYHRFSHYLNLPMKAFGHFIYIADEIRSDMESLQQLGFTCYSIFRIYHFRASEDQLPPVLGSLNRVQEIDFFNFLKIPQYVKHRYTAESVNAVAFLNNIHLNNPLLKQDELKNKVKEFLDYINERDLGYFTQSQFKRAFSEYNSGLNLNLTSVLVELHFKPFLFLSDLFTIFADILCVPVFLQEWSIRDLSKIAYSIGKVKLLKWFPNQCADNWVKRFLCVSFAFRLLNACLEIKDARMTPQEKKANLVCAIASLGECILNICLLKGVKERYIALILLLPKPTGILYKFLKPSPTYFSTNDNI